MIFLNWIDPPIGVNMQGIDSAHPFYKVRLMSIGTVGGGPTLIIPYAEPFQWNNPQVSPYGMIECRPTADESECS